MKKIQSKSVWLSALSILAIFALLLQTGSVKALDYGPNDVIAAVNSLRAEYGLPAYAVNQSLNDIAQQQAEYMASIGSLTHERADGSGVPTTAENIAYGPVSTAMASWVDDQLHFDTLTGWSTGQIGVGIAEANGYVYICLNVNRNSDTVFTSIPFTQPPGTVVVENATTDSTVPEYTAADTTTTSDNQTEQTNDTGVEDMTAGTPVAMTLEDDGTEGKSPEVDATVELPAPDNIQEIVIESRTGKLVAYGMMGLGALGLLGSIIGMIYSLRLMGSKSKSNKSKKQKPKKAKAPTGKPDVVEDTSSSQEIAHEAQEE